MIKILLDAKQVLQSYYHVPILFESMLFEFCAISEIAFITFVI